MPYAQPIRRAVALITALVAFGLHGRAQRAAPGTLHERYEQRLARRAEERRRQVQVGLAEARMQGKPVLVLVVPEATFFEFDPDVAARSRILSGLLLTQDRDLRAALALLRPIAAKLSELQAILGIAPPPGLPCALLLDPPPEPALGRSATTAVHCTPIAVDGRSADFVASAAATTKVERERQLEFLRTKEREFLTALPQAIAAHGIDAAALARAVESRLSAGEHRAIRNWLDGGAQPEPALLVRAAPWVLQAAEGLPAPSGLALRTAVATAFAQWILAAGVPGARWAGPAYSEACIREPNLPALPGRYLRFHEAL